MPTNPGIHPNFRMECYTPTVRSAIRRIADHFYVTRSFERVDIGNSAYFGALIRPTNETSVYLNAQREILVIFADYPTFEIRTLEAFDRFYDLVESARIDDSVRIVVSADQNIETHIRLWLRQKPEYPIVIPMTFTDLDRKVNPIVAAVQRNYVIRDLFSFQSPLREEHFFFGREKVVSAVIDSAKSGQHTSLFGLRKSGKTSTIYAIQRKCRGSGLSTVMIDCQDVAVHGRRYNELLIWLVNRVRLTLGMKSVPKPNDVSGPAVSDWFHQTMKQTLLAARYPILLIFDEIENISPKTAASMHWRTSLDSVYFWQVIRSFAQSQQPSIMTLCFVGTSPQMLETARIHDVDNPVYLLASKNFIPNLSFDETRDMVSRLGFFMGIDFPPDIVAIIHREYGGHPFFTRQACGRVNSLLSADRPISVSQRCLSEAMAGFSSEMGGYLTEIVRSLDQSYPEEVSALAAFVNGETEEIREYAASAPDLIDHLIGYGLIRVNAGDVEVAFSAVVEAITAIRPKIQDSSKAAQWAEVCSRRGILEQRIRAALFFWTINLGTAEFQSLLGSALTERRFQSLISLEPSVLFGSESSPLYLTDLMAILKHQNLQPYMKGRSSLVSSNIDIINRLRKDAHANDFNSDEMNALLIAFSVIEPIFGIR